MMIDRRSLLLSVSAAAAALPSFAQTGRVEGVFGTRVRVEVFSDFQCPGCKQLHEGTIRELRNEYVASGRVQLVHHEFPLPMHPYARQAALYACAADKLGQYRNVCDALFRDQQIWSQNGQMDATLAKVLKAAELAKVKALAQDPKIVAEVNADVELGKKAPVTQTPTMLVTAKGKTQPIAGAISYAIFRRYIETLLA
ncbi:MAG: thioredoxin domain-containing protein [Acidobacteria bacterium]|nr:thioredoxin domain-containing protein [Acidobacteriota bacterium]